MSLQTPTTTQISENIVAQLEASLGQNIPPLAKSFFRILSKAVAGVFVLLYKFGGFTFLQMFVRTASNSPTVVNGVTIIPLVEWGRLIGIGDPKAATSAELNISINVDNQTGSLPIGSQLVGADNGVTYITLSAVPLTAPIVFVVVRAVSDQAGGGGAGVIGNLSAGAIISFANPLPNVSRDAVVLNHVITGADAESTEIYRQKIINRFQRPPQGGSYVDYGEWGLEPEGILNIYPYTSVNPGQVDVYAEATVASSGNPDGIPTAPQLQAVYDSIQLDEDGLATRRPANAFVNVYPIYRTPFVIEVNGITGIPPASIPQAKADITAALTQYIANREPFIIGYTIGINNSRILNTEISGIVNTIVVTYGGLFSNTLLIVAGTTVSLYALDEGEKAKIDNIGFSP